jgi:DNA-binding beta-propeller fold protein YncE
MVRIETIKSILRICAAVLVLLMGLGCSDDDGVTPDVTAPKVVTDLVISDTTASSVTLTWTAPGDDGMRGMASQYDIRYSTRAIAGDAEFNTSARALGIPSPGAPGTVDTLVVTGLAEHATYYFALKTKDEASNWSALSNVACGKTCIAIPQFVLAWGSAGWGDGQFFSPVGIAADGNGNVYVTEWDPDVWSNCRIQKFEGSGKFITKWGSLSPLDTGFVRPNGIAVDASGNVYVADLLHNYIQEFSGDGAFLSKIGGDRIFIASDVAIGGWGRIYAADEFDGCVLVYRNGEYYKQWGTPGPGDGQFSGICGVAVDGNGNVLVADTGYDRVQKFNSGGTFLMKWGSSGPGDGQFNGPYRIAVDVNNNVYVVDQGNNRIQKFDANGTYLTQWGSLGSGDGQFNSPSGIAVDWSGNIYVVDTGNDRIQKFR